MSADASWARSEQSIATARPVGFALPCSLVLSGMLFNALLCFLNTRGIHISEMTVVASEIVIISATFAAAIGSIQTAPLLLILVCQIYIVAIGSVRGDVQGAEVVIKTIRDLIIPMAFFLLGTCVQNLGHVDRIVTWSAVIIGTGAVFEFAFVDTFLRYFDIITFYVNKGAVAAARLSTLGTQLYVSGMRPEGRILLPVLGDHRISSFFLEPVSLGNYGVILFFWALTRARHLSRRTCGAWAIVALLLIVGADARVGAYLCAAALIITILPKGPVSLGLLVGPVLAIVTLLAVGAALPDGLEEDTFLGRVLASGHLLWRFGWDNWLGLGDMSWEDFDSGYAYLIGRIGVPGLAGLWCILFAIRCADTQSQLFRLLVSLYLCVLLSISYSAVTIKTASLLWFLFGAAVASAAWRAGCERAATGRRGAERAGRRQDRLSGLRVQEAHASLAQEQNLDSRFS